MVGYLLLWSVFGFSLIRGKEGMGYGDFKLLAAMGAWQAGRCCHWIILLSSVIGVIAGTVVNLRASKGLSARSPLAPTGNSRHDRHALGRNTDGVYLGPAQ